MQTWHQSLINVCKQASLHRAANLAGKKRCMIEVNKIFSLIFSTTFSFHQISHQFLIQIFIQLHNFSLSLFIQFFIQLSVQLFTTFHSLFIQLSVNSSVNSSSLSLMKRQQLCSCHKLFQVKDALNQLVSTSKKLKILEILSDVKAH